VLGRVAKTKPVDGQKETKKTTEVKKGEEAVKTIQQSAVASQPSQTFISGTPAETARINALKDTCEKKSKEITDNYKKYQDACKNKPKLSIKRIQEITKSNNSEDDDEDDDKDTTGGTRGSRGGRILCRGHSNL
jgi:hypothetical protein